MTNIQFDGIEEINQDFVCIKFSDLRLTKIEIVIPISDLLLIRNSIAEYNK